MSVHLHKNGAYWVARWRDSLGRLRARSLGNRSAVSRRAAEHRCRQIEVEFALAPAAKDMGDAPSLGTWIDEYISLAADELGEKTMTVVRGTTAYLRQHFGDGVRIDRINAAACEDFAKWLGRLNVGTAQRPEHLSPVTVAGHVRRARTLFGRALKRGRIVANPWSVVVKASPAKRETWVDSRMIEPLLAACPDASWRSLMALCIHAGCRRGEGLALKWSSVRWHERRIVMPNMKTARSTGATTRTVRMEPELERVLLECREAINGELVAPVSANNIDRNVLAVYERAGIDCKSDPFRVWRRWRNDSWIAAGFPEAVVDQWLGHSRSVARSHYDGVPAEYYGEATPLKALAEAQSEIAALKARLTTG